MKELFDSLKENEYVFVSFKVMADARTVPSWRRVTLFNLSKNERGALMGSFNLDGVETTAPINYYGWLDGITGGLFKDYGKAVTLFNRYVMQRGAWLIRSEIVPGS